jgi:hypothetical protein
VFRRLHVRVEGNNRTFDPRGVGEGVIAHYGSVAPDEDPDKNNSSKFIRNMTLREFRSVLIDHFHYLWSSNRVVWPSHTGIVAH